MTKKITRKELIKKYKEFFKNKKHEVIPSGSLIPMNDPSVLFTTAGMHPLVPYLLGQKHPLGKRIVNVQKCIRTTDIDEVGDTIHHTFFEMLGNWSLGDYWKKESIEMSLEFLTKKLGIEKEKLAVSVFKGNEDAPKDEESAKVWENLKIGRERIAYLGKRDNWWGPAGETGPCGPDTEIFYWNSQSEIPKKFDPQDKRWVEIWNNVFMQYNKTSDGKLEPLSQKNVDTGMGVERTVAALNGINDNYLTESFKPLIDEIEHLWNIKYDSEKNKRLIRIVADHIKAAVFIAAEGITPSNTEQGYVLRKLIRRAYTLIYRHGNKGDLLSPLAEKILDIYSDYNLRRKWKEIYEIIKNEERKFEKTIEKGLSKFESMIKNKKALSGKDAFLLYQSYGFPIELTMEMAKEKNVTVDKKAFDKEYKKHQKLSKTASKGRFSSGLADKSEKTIKLHTATHLLNEALRQVLGKEVKQKGSNITPERLRFDFNFPRKLTKEEIRKLETLVNEKIKQGLKVTSEEMPLKKALNSGAQSEFGTKYPEVVSVYSIGNFSKEICTGPHVKNTKEIGKFKILKEKSSAAGVRRIRAVVE